MNKSRVKIVVRREVYYYAGPEERVEDLRSCGAGQTREEALKDWLGEISAMECLSDRHDWDDDKRETKRLIRENRKAPIKLWRPRPRKKAEADDDIPF